MASKTVTALNTVSGVVGPVPAHYIDHPVLGENLVEVPEGTKSFDPEFFKAGSAEDHKAKETSKRKSQVTEGTDVPLLASDAPSA